MSQHGLTGKGSLVINPGRGGIISDAKTIQALAGEFLAEAIAINTKQVEINVRAGNLRVSSFSTSTPLMQQEFDAIKAMAETLRPRKEKLCAIGMELAYRHREYGLDPMPVVRYVRRWQDADYDAACDLAAVVVGIAKVGK